jgi:formylglycine-generating enzyme required for sulfatase activity
VNWSIGAAVALLAIGGAILYLHQDGSRQTEKPEANAGASAKARTLAGNNVEEITRAARTPEEAHKQEALVRDCPDCPRMVAIPAGEFMMGTPVSEGGRFEDEGPQHRVQVKAFYLGRYEVTRGEFDRFVKESGRSMPRCFSSPGYSQQDNHPAVCVSWESARAYAQWLSAKTGERYRLPSEAEWEYAARAGASTSRFWGDNSHEACRYANVDGAAHGCDDGHEQTAPVGSYAPNRFGLYDMLGNVWEWTEDCWNENYSGAPSDGSTWLSGNCSIRVNRGGSFNYLPRIVRSGKRNKSSVADRLDDFGFRLARTPQ